MDRLRTLQRFFDYFCVVWMMLWVFLCVCFIRVRFVVLCVVCLCRAWYFVCLCLNRSIVKSIYFTVVKPVFSLVNLTDYSHVGYECCLQ